VTDSNFMLQDIISTFLGFLLFPVVLMVPGYIAGWMLDLFDFRERRLHSRLALSLLFSVAISPVLFYLLSSLFSFRGVFLVLTLAFIVFVALVLIDKPRIPSFRNKAMRWIVFCVLLWILISLFSIVDIEVGKKLYFSMVAFDHTTRISLVDAIARTGVPPMNPSFYPGHAVQLNLLYFFWYILGSIIDQIGGAHVDARGAFFASIIWCGIALMVTIAFYLRLRNKRLGTNIWTLVLIGIGCLAVTGLDILPASLTVGSVPVGDIEQWNEQITAWAGSLLWVPHHVAALIACLIGVMLALSIPGQKVIRQYILMAVAGTSFASAFGLSVWVTLVFVIFWGIWILVRLFIDKDKNAILPMLFAGVIAIALSSTFLAGVLAGLSESGGTNSRFPIVFEVRSFLILDAFTASSPRIIQSALRLVFLPLNYFMELGFFFLVGVVWLRQRRRDLSTDRYYLMETLLLGTVLFVGSFMRSTLISNNDLGWRAWLPGQFILLIWGVDVLNQFRQPVQTHTDIRPWTKMNLVVLAMLGIATTCLDLYLLRSVYLTSFGPETGARMYSARMAYTAVNQYLPANAIIQYNPENFVDRPSGLYGMHQSVISDRTAYGVPQDAYNERVTAIQKIFDVQNLSNWQPVDNLCQQNFINALVIDVGDKLWKSLDTLKEERPPLYMDENYAVFTCGDGVTSHFP
jgi:hypothetical protein